MVSGTHGKTTTTFLIDHVLSAAGKKPGLFAGGVRADGMDGFRLSDSPYFIIEGDEYDTAFFDKSPKFVHYRPKVLVLTSVEYDHADIFPDLKSYRQAFERLLQLIPSQGIVVACREDKGVREILKEYKHSPVDWYDKKCFRRDGDSVDFDLAKRIHRFPLPGDHNALNACAAIRVAHHLGVSAEKIRFALGGFPGVLRRQQLRLEVQVPIHERAKKTGGRVFAPAALVEDFAHHPTAVRETIAAVAQRYPGRRITAMFEPRSASSHRELFRKDYTSAFKLADDVILCDVFNKKKVAKPELMDVKRIARDLAAMKKAGRSPKGKAQYAADPKAAFNLFRKSFKPSPQGDVILMMSNGAFGGIYSTMDDYLKSLASP
ncbi:MAG: UDP-N-acetylmuramate--alanine ligase [Spirochaetia bacterium]|nr:UDP-N-acetylmuramate--alanine ligase [Spirochaetia bacterium]